MFSSGIEGCLGSDLFASAAGGKVVSDSAFAMLLCATLTLCVEAGVSFTLICFSSSIAPVRSVGILYSSAAPSSRCWLSCYTDSNFIELFLETSVSTCCCYFSYSTIAGTSSWLLLAASTSGCFAYLASYAYGTSLVSSSSMPFEAAWLVLLFSTTRAASLISSCWTYC